MELKRGKTWNFLFFVRISSVIPLNDLVFYFQISGQVRLSVSPLFTPERGKRVILNKKIVQKSVFFNHLLIILALVSNAVRLFD